MNKKGYIQDFAFFGVFILAFVIVIIIGGKWFSDYNDKYQLQNTSTTGIGQQMMQQSVNRYSNLFDWTFMTVFILMIVGLFISFLLIDSHPAFFFFILILFAFIIIALAILQNVFEKFTGGSMATEAAKFPLLDYVMNHWVLFMVVIGFVGITLLFAKMKTGWFQ